VVVDGGLQLRHPLAGKGGLQRGLQVGEAGLDRGGLGRETGAAMPIVVASASEPATAATRTPEDMSTIS